MIPQQITVSNFLSYGEQPQTISFEGYSLICLSGRNGHGKSALLDAMTWALWGQARKTTGTSKPDEGLLRLGARSMMVMFEFYIGPALYRVRREFTLRQGNKPHVTLDVSVYDAATTQYHSLTDKTIRQTQAVINRAVGLEYDTYINSAYLRQGNANEFSQKAPKDRKKILTAILGIDKYDRLQTMALERARDYSNQIQILKEFMARDEVDLENYPVLIVQEEVAAEGIVEVDEQLKKYELARRVAQDTYGACAAQEKEYHARLEALGQEQLEQSAQRQAWGQLAAQYRIESGVIRHAASRAQVQALLADLRNKEQVMRNLQKQLMAIQQKMMGIEKELFARQNSIEQEISRGRQDRQQQQQVLHLGSEQARNFEKQLRVQKEQALAENTTLEHQLLAAGGELQKLKEASGSFELVRNRFDKRKLFYNTYVPRLRWLQDQLHEREQKSAMVSDESPACPLCEQMLTVKRKHFLHEKLTKEMAIFSHQKNRLQALLERLKAVLIADHAVIKALVKAINDGQRLKEQLDQKGHDLRQYEAEAVFVVTHDEQLNSLRATLNQCAAQVTSINYDEQAHLALEQQIVEVAVHAAAIDKVDERRAALAALRATLDAQRAQLKEKQRLLCEKQRCCLAMVPDKAVAERALSGLQQAEEAIAQLLKHKQALANRQGHLAAQRLRLEEQKKAMMARVHEVALLDAQYYDCTVLANAWSKNGIQALLIEQAIPEIEHEANELLSRLSNNQAQVFIESLRDLKRGGARETLDIKIADVMGVRPYEMFSGGEAFRIDFALRIAISKLLAKRAGATLQVLIIDEGFGSQDEEGLARLMQALYMVQDDFAKIIVVTHLPAFKENFPVHFIVEKGAAGSVVSVELRG